MDNEPRPDASIVRESLLDAAKYGASAFVVGLAITYAVLVAETGEFVFEPLGFGGAFYGAHFVEVSGPSFRGGGFDMLDVFTVPGRTEYLNALRVVPPLALGAAGYAFADSDTGVSLGDDRRSGAKAGALVASGYVVLAVVGSFVFAEDGVSPELLSSAVLMGVIYPVVFGAIGGYLSR